jgi:hypothetical protein
MDNLCRMIAVSKLSHCVSGRVDLRHQAVDVVGIPTGARSGNDLARNTAVKACDIHTVREFEDFLRDIGGFSPAAAKSIARAGFKAADAEPSGLEALVASLRDVRRGI